MMKTKPFFINFAGTILLAGIIVFAACSHKERPEQADITKFLYAVSNRINEGNTQELLALFDSHKVTKPIKRLVNLLTGKNDIGGNTKPLADIKLDVDGSIINIVNTNLVVATIPVLLRHETIESKNSVIILKIYKIAAHKFKIIKVDARSFLNDYIAYANFIRSRAVPDKDLFSPITLAAFKTAGQLKTKYDSVIWFDYIDGKTYYYVVKGKWSLEKDIDKNAYYKDSVVEPYKMGLINPDLIEIIPPEYDLIHNVNGTIDGLVEVEKGEKKGLYNLDGKLILPVNYDEIFPLKNDDNLALLQTGSDYSYLKKDLTTTDKIAGLKIEEELPKIKTYGSTYTLSDSTPKNIMEYNSRDKFTSLIIPPSYLVDLQILPRDIDFQNPLRHPSEEEVGDGDGNLTYDVKYSGAQKEEGNWFESIYYSVVDSYLGGRSGLYTTKNFVMVDKKQNKLLSFSADSYHGRGEGGGELSSPCNENNLRSIGDTLFEFKTTANLEVDLYNEKEFINTGPYYHYMHLVNGKMVAIPCERTFTCTKFVKMDDSYLDGCYSTDNKTSTDHVTLDMLRYMKNEIYASYNYKFKDKRWNEVFQYTFARDSVGKNFNVDDSLTAIEKYNIQWINSKLNKPKSNNLAAR